MANKCWRVTGSEIGAGSTVTYYFVDTVNFIYDDSQGYARYQLSIDGTGNGKYYYSGVGAEIVAASPCPVAAPPPLDPAQPHDCINGSCIPSTVYGTSKAYASLAACKSGCGKNSSCTGECVDPAEIAALQQAVGNLQSKICK